MHMDCAGCEKTVRKALQDMKGVDSIEIDMAMQKVTVTGIADQKKVLKIVRRTGRRAELWQLPYNPVLRNNNYTNHYNYNQHYYGGPSTYFAAPPPSSSYNYYKHGYDENQHRDHQYYGYGNQGGSSIFGSRAGDAFSEESVHGCSVM